MACMHAARSILSALLRTHSADAGPRHMIRMPQAQKEGEHATVYLASGEQYKGEWRDNMRHGERARTRHHLAST
jgi:hypothetical protein